jgi:hypothetical protein
MLLFQQPFRFELFDQLLIQISLEKMLIFLAAFGLLLTTLGLFLLLM